MEYRQIQPPEALKPYVQYFLVLDSGSVFENKRTFKVLADGYPGLVFQANPQSFLYQGKALSQLFLHGLITTYSDKTTTGFFYNIVVCFQPHALRQVFGIGAHELTDQYIDLDLVLKNNLIDQLAIQTTASSQIHILSTFILDQLKLNQQREIVKIRYAIEKLKNQPTEGLLRTIQSELALSERSLERLFKSSIGISPKLYFRINRFQRALSCLRNTPRQSFSAIAYACNYADQSHYIREFNEFSGTTPKLFLEQSQEQIMNFPEWKM